MLHHFDLCNYEVDRLLSEVVDADDKHRAAISLQLTSSGPNQHQRAFLP